MFGVDTVALVVLWRGVEGSLGVDSITIPCPSVTSRQESCRVLLRISGGLTFLCGFFDLAFQLVSLPLSSVHLVERLLGV